jgi:hypothetical protein
VEELKPLAASIAHNRAVSLLRERFAKKRGEGKTASLDAQPDEGANPHEPALTDSPLADLEQKELRSGSGNHSQNSNRRWVTSFQISFSAICTTRKLPGAVA